MNNTDRKQFIQQLCNNVRDEILANSDRFPDGWDGNELRQYIADRYKQVVIGDAMSDKRGKRYREYENIVLIENL